MIRFHVIISRTIFTYIAITTPNIISTKNTNESNILKPNREGTRSLHLLFLNHALIRGNRVGIRGEPYQCRRSKMQIRVTCDVVTWVRGDLELRMTDSGLVGSLNSRSRLTILRYKDTNKYKMLSLCEMFENVTAISFVNYVVQSAPSIILNVIHPVEVT